MNHKYNYNEEKNSVEWQKKVDEIRQRDNYTCQLCGAQDKQVQVHHTWYDQKLHYWEYPNELLITLCKDCHSKETDLVRRFKKTRPSLDLNIAYFLESMMKKGILLTKMRNVFEQMGTGYCTTPMITATNIQHNLYHQVSFSIDEKKQIFFQVLQPLESKYDKDYIQTFLEYWLAEKMGKLRFEIGENKQNIDVLGITTDYMSVKLENWRLNYDFIKKERESTPLLDEFNRLCKKVELDYTNNDIELRCRDLDAGEYGTSDRLLGKLLFDKGLFLKEIYKIDRFLDKREYIPLCMPIDRDKEISLLNQFKILYEAKQAFQMNKAFNQSILKSISPQITFKSFCIEHNIKYPQNLKKDKSIQELVNSQKFPIEIEYSYGSLSIWIRRSTHHDLYRKLNELLGLKLLLIESSEGGTHIKVPANILYMMDGTQFDFRDDSFENGTMKSIKLPTKFKDIAFYVAKIIEIQKNN